MVREVKSFLVLDAGPDGIEDLGRVKPVLVHEHIEAL